MWHYYTITIVSANSSDSDNREFISIKYEQTKRCLLCPLLPDALLSSCLCLGPQDLPLAESILSAGLPTSLFSYSPLDCSISKQIHCSQATWGHICLLLERIASTSSSHVTSRPAMLWENCLGVLDARDENSTIIYPFIVCPPIYVFIFPSLHPSTYPFTYLSIIYLSVHPSSI